MSDLIDRRVGPDAAVRAAASREPVPSLPEASFVTPPPIPSVRVGIVTTAALIELGQQLFAANDQSFRVVKSTERLRLAHTSPNFDRSGWLSDPDVVFPARRLEELALAGEIGSVASRHISFAGNQTTELTNLLCGSAPSAAAILREDGVDVALITGL